MPQFYRATGKLTAAQRRDEDVKFEEWCQAERRRCELQRSAFAALYPNNAKDRLQQAMLDRAWALLDAGECEAADALLEFLPSREADALLDEFFRE